MKNNTAFVLTIAILSLSFVFYQAWVVVPKEKMQQQKQQEDSVKIQKDTFYKEYEDCKDYASQEYSFNWLRGCSAQKPLSKECSALLIKGIPWEDYYLYRHFQKSNYFSNYSQDGFNRYREFLKLLDSCSCDTLPKYLAENNNSDLEKAVKSCEREFEVKLKTIE